MRIFRSPEEVRAAKNLEPGTRAALGRVLGDLVSAYANEGFAYDPDDAGPVVLVEQGDTDEDWRNLIGCALHEAPLEGAIIEFDCFITVVFSGNEYAYAIIVPNAPWLDRKVLARLISVMG